MNISSHSFVPTSLRLGVNGNYLQYFSYFFSSLLPAVPFPLKDTSYRVQVNPSSSFQTFLSDNITLLPYCIADNIRPFVKILLLY